MQSPRPGNAWFFVDESGDPTFYDSRGRLIVGQEGCSPILMLGFIKTPDPQPIRAALLDLQKQVINDSYFQNRPSLAKTAISFHAKNDLPEIRYLVYKLICTFDIQAHIVVARKRQDVFHRSHIKGNENTFYDHIVSCLFKDNLHLYEQNYIYFSKRKSKTRQKPLADAIEKGRQRFARQCKSPAQTSYNVQAQSPSGEPCLSVTDYMLWAVYRAYTRGEMQYFDTVREQVRVVADIYDDENRPRNWYTRRKNPFNIERVTPLKLDPVEGHTAWSRLSLTEE